MPSSKEIDAGDEVEVDFDNGIMIKRQMGAYMKIVIYIRKKRKEEE